MVEVPPSPKSQSWSTAPKTEGKVTFNGAQPESGLSEKPKLGCGNTPTCLVIVSLHPFAEVPINDTLKLIMNNVVLIY